MKKNFSHINQQIDGGNYSLLKKYSFDNSNRRVKSLANEKFVWSDDYKKSFDKIFNQEFSIYRNDSKIRIDNSNTYKLFFDFSEFSFDLFYDLLFSNTWVAVFNSPFIKIRVERNPSGAEIDIMEMIITERLLPFSAMLAYATNNITFFSSTDKVKVKKMIEALRTLAKLKGYDSSDTKRLINSYIFEVILYSFDKKNGLRKYLDSFLRDYENDLPEYTNELYKTIPIPSQKSQDTSDEENGKDESANKKKDKSDDTFYYEKTDEFDAIYKSLVSYRKLKKKRIEEDSKQAELVNSKK